MVHAEQRRGQERDSDDRPLEPAVHAAVGSYQHGSREQYTNARLVARRLAGTSAWSVESMAVRQSATSALMKKIAAATGALRAHRNLVTRHRACTGYLRSGMLQLLRLPRLASLARMADYDCG